MKFHNSILVLNNIKFTAAQSNVTEIVTQQKYKYSHTQISLQPKLCVS